MNFQPSDPAPHGHCLRCKSFVIEDEQRGGICIDCQPAEDGERPAFPVAANEYAGHGPSLGITVRDYFAAKAMQALISTAAAPCLFGLDDAEHHTAKAAYKMADAMLASRAFLHTA